MTGLAPESVPRPPTTRFAPAPTGRLHLGHLANAIYVWGLARRAGARVILRIEDHDRQRCRPEYETALLDDLDRLGLAGDVPSTDELRAGASPFRQSDCHDMYAARVAQLRARDLVYACDCSRSTFDAWRAAHDRPWTGEGCPGSCRERELAMDEGLGLRVALGGGDEAWDDLLLGPRDGPVAQGGDLLLRDRNGNWTYVLCVVVDDLRHGVDLAVRGEDLVDATPVQIRLGRRLGRRVPPTFAHHALVRRPDGHKLSKADNSTSIGELLDAGATREALFGEAAHRAGLLPGVRALSFEDAVELVGQRSTRMGAGANVT